MESSDRYRSGNHQWRGSLKARKRPQENSEGTTFVGLWRRCTSHATRRPTRPPLPKCPPQIRLQGGIFSNPNNLSFEHHFQNSATALPSSASSHCLHILLQTLTCDFSTDMITQLDGHTEVSVPGFLDKQEV
jgi:hypothetical protein